MAEQAKVTSVEAIAAFRAQLIVYLSKARPALEEVSAEVTRTRIWIENDQRRFWQNEVRVRRKKLERVQAELFGASMSKFQQPSAAQQMAVRKAREAVDEAEGKLVMLKKWDRELENQTDPFMKQINQLQHSLVSEMPRAVAFLDQAVRTLEAYAGIVLPGSRESSPAPDAAAGPEESGGEEEVP
jgi:hypothetical protein